MQEVRNAKRGVECVRLESQAEVVGKDALTDQTVTVSFDMKQPWGQTGLALEAANFLLDPAKYRVVLNGTLDP